jgi:protease-4
MADTNETGGAGWERQTLERLALATLEEQRRARRWKIVRFFVLLAVFLLVFFAQSQEWAGKPLASRYTALVEMQGVIAPEEMASADNVIAGLRAAFEDKAAVGVILRLNSPGGSPVQSRYIFDEIKRLREKYPDKSLYAVVTDICASGCYYAAAAADKIYASPGSMVGSIGVLMNGFGFTEAMKKLGVERRLLTAGENKAILDPFSPLKPEDRRHAQQMLNNIHQQFIQAVRDGRGKALKESKDMFSGLFWTGDQAKQMGLVDEFGSASQVAREVIKAEEIVDFTFRENVLDRFARRFGSAMGESLSLRLFGPAVQ